MLRKLFHRIAVFCRYCAIEEARKKRILREFHESWYEENQDFVREMEKETDREVEDFCRCAGTYYDFTSANCKKTYY